MTILEGTRLCRRVGGKTLLKDASIVLVPGELLGIVGPNGAGKSTLLRLLAGLDQPDAGQVTLGDTLLRQWPARERARMIGYLPQHFSPHWDYRVAELLRLGLERAAGGMAGLSSLAARHGLETLVDRRWSGLSGGERGRTLAAAVLAPAPPVILADEPAAALDIGQAAALMGLLLAQARGGAAVAVVIHDLNLAGRWCDRLVLMDSGRILATGTSDAILSDLLIDTVFRVRFERLVTTEKGRVVLAPSV